MSRHLVLLPGFMCDDDLWSDMKPDLEAMGSLQFGNVFEDDSLDGMATRVLGQAPRRFVLVGFSMGGFVARRIALLAPERVAGVAFICSSARGHSEAERAGRDARIAAVRGATSSGVSRRAHADALHPDRDREPALLDRLRGMSRRLGREVMIRQLSVAREDGYLELERILCPALVVAARQDRLRGFAETERMARHLPDARFEVIEACGHMAPLERPRELAHLLADWIAKEAL